MAKVKVTKSAPAPLTLPKKAVSPAPVAKVEAKKPASTLVTETREVLLAKAAKLGLKNRRAMNLVELAEVTKTGTSKARIDEILKKAVSRWRSGLGKGR